MAVPAEQLVIEVRGAVEAAGIAVVVCVIASGLVGEGKDVLCMGEVAVRIGALILEGTVAGSQRRSHLAADSGVCPAQHGSCLVVVCAVVLHAVLQQLYRPPPGVIHLSAAHLIDHGVALIAGGEVVQHEGEVVHVGLHLSGALHAVRILVQSPCQHGGGVRHGQVEFDVVAGIVPAACDLIAQRGVGTPFHTIPGRQRSGLLAFVKVQGLLQGFRIVLGIGGGGRQRTCAGHSAGAQTDRQKKSGESVSFVHWLHSFLSFLCFVSEPVLHRKRFETHFK